MNKANAMEAVGFSDSIEFNHELIKSLNHSINYIINSNLKCLNELGYDYDDAYQECLGFVNNAIRLYRPNKGAKFSTFAIEHIKDRLKNLRRKTRTKKRFSEHLKITNATDSKSWPLFGTEHSNDHENLTSMIEDENDSINFLIDLNNKIELDLNESQKNFFISHFVKGEAIQKIKQTFYFKNTKNFKKDLKEIRNFYERNVF